ncbi:MAG TPA: helix-turn-helix transcriptional regulator [Flavisolibacter sp.]|nr:helix-turn-helix transcriptional regulator [Flavisolibacter sp.]
MSTKSIFSQNLKYKRKQNRWTQQKAADQMGVPLKRYQSYEYDIAEAPHAVLIKAKEVYKETIDRLLTVNLTITTV